jgi:hypothetical protein
MERTRNKFEPSKKFLLFGSEVGGDHSDVDGETIVFESVIVWLQG